MMSRVKSVAKVLAFVALGAYGTALATGLDLPVLSLAFLAFVGIFAAWRQPAVAAGAMLFAAGALGGVVGVGFVALSVMAAYRWRSSLMSPRSSTSSEASVPLRYGLGMGNARELFASVATAVALAIVLLPVILDAEPNNPPEVTVRDALGLSDSGVSAEGATSNDVQGNVLSRAGDGPTISAIEQVRLAEIQRARENILLDPSFSIGEPIGPLEITTTTEGSPPWYVLVAVALVTGAVVYAATRLRSAGSLESAEPTDSSRAVADVVERFDELGRSLGVERPEHMGVRSFGRLLGRETGDPRFMQLGDSISARLYGGSADVEAMEQILTEFERDHSAPD